MPLKITGVLETPDVSATTDLTQAISLAQTAHEKDPNDWNNYFNLALYHLAAGHHPEATHLYQTGLETAPTWAIRMAYTDLPNYLQLFPNDAVAQDWRDQFSQHPRFKQHLAPEGETLK
jgi:tetratricopeptide (TPR) repeat protein